MKCEDSLRYSSPSVKDAERLIKVLKENDLTDVMDKIIDDLEHDISVLENRVDELERELNNA